jgi:hypothetical protein
MKQRSVLSLIAHVDALRTIASHAYLRHKQVASSVLDTFLANNFFVEANQAKIFILR